MSPFAILDSWILYMVEVGEVGVGFDGSILTEGKIFFVFFLWYFFFFTPSFLVTHKKATANPREHYSFPAESRWTHDYAYDLA